MQNLLLDNSHEAYLTDRITGELVRDSEGKPYRIAQDIISGKYYKKLCDYLPTEKDSVSSAKRDSILSQNPIQARNHGGYWVELAGYSPILTDAEVAASKAAK